MVNKILVTSIILVLVLGVIWGGLFFFFQLGSKGTIDEVESTSDDGAAKLTATFYDFSGDEPTSGVVQSLIGGTNKRTHVSFQLQATNTGDVDLSDVTTTNPNANMNGAFDNLIPLASLLTTDSNVIVGDTAQTCTNTGGTVCDGIGVGGCDANEECCPTNTCLVQLDQYASADAETSNNVDFIVSLLGNYIDALGTPQQTTSSSVILSYDIRGEKCSDGTTINTCVFDRTAVDTDKPNYCEFTEGSTPSIVEKSSICGCPVGEQPDGETCVPLTCPDGTNINTFSTASGSFSVTTPSGTSIITLTNGYAPLTAETTNTRVFCKADQTLETQCNNAEATLGGNDADYSDNEACQNDALGRPAISCSASEPSICVFSGVSACLSGTIGEG